MILIPGVVVQWWCHVFRWGSGTEDEDRLRPGELTPAWDPTSDARLTAWEMVHHLIRVLKAGGVSGVSVLAAKLGTKTEVTGGPC